MLTPYQFAGNRPIQGIDLEGLEFFDMAGRALGPISTAQLQRYNDQGYSIKSGNATYVGLTTQTNHYAIHQITYTSRIATFQEAYGEDADGNTLFRNKDVRIDKFSVSFNNGGTTSFLSFTTDMDTEDDGAVTSTDPKHRSDTYFFTRDAQNNETYLDGSRDAFIAVPFDELRQDGVVSAELGIVTHNGQHTYGIVGDRSDGPINGVFRSQIGEVSLGLSNSIPNKLPNFQGTENTRYDIILNTQNGAPRGDRKSVV